MPPSTPSHPGRTSSKRRTPTFTKIAKDWAAAPLPVDVLHGLAFQLLPTFVPQLADPSLKPLLDFATTSLSGVLLGMVGPVVGPALALGAGTQAIGNALTGSNPDPAAAFNALINIPATMTGAFLNGGQVMDITQCCRL